jgi:NAD(P)H dehydrogenase (quinone)
MGAAPNATFPFARDHGDTEQTLREAGIGLTSMRNALYADVAPLFVGADGVIRAPAGRGRVAWVARADWARLAVVLLTEPGS